MEGEWVVMDAEWVVMEGEWVVMEGEWVVMDGEWAFLFLLYYILVSGFVSFTQSLFTARGGAVCWRVGDPRVGLGRP